ncbi:glycosyltransferase family 15 protein [Moniliophthora roreri MCA 2997]|uniref:Glycosyltransferase family 15 protein n=2 Tax=Moniliophthora roreri TaxID=221103 RepID=V2XEL3_MONRO|nr:glycosyltransferase family 15 protein [Moniliophthora roreri MCA 2997]
MNMVMRYTLLVLGVVISLHYLLSFTNEPYGRATSINRLADYFRGGSAAETHPIPEEYFKDNNDAALAIDRKANATFVILARNTDLDNTVRSIRRMEDRFNRFYRYPYVLLNEEPFTEEFKKRVSNVISSNVEFGLIPRDHWFQPDWIDEDKATAGRKKLEEEGVIYGGSLSYRNMCRFNSGFFFHHPLMQKYRWYWRIEPDVHFHCDVTFDPFLFMEDNDKIYGFTITMYEFEKTIPTLWGHVKEFMKLHPEFVSPDNAMGFMSENNGDSYNLCHFWSNFEIADMNFWRGEAYQKFFEFLDSKGGFYYERWGDAPVHSIAAALFARKDQIHFFDDIGYEHNPYTHCPKNEESWKRGRCGCDPKRSFDYDGYSCLSKWDRLMEG